MYRFLRGRSSRRKIYKVRLALFLPAKVDFWILRKSYRGPVYTNPLWHDFYRLKATSVDYVRFVLSQLLELSTNVLRRFDWFWSCRGISSRRNVYKVAFRRVLSTIRHFWNVYLYFWSFRPIISVRSGFLYTYLHNIFLSPFDLFFRWARFRFTLIFIDQTTYLDTSFSSDKKRVLVSKTLCILWAFGLIFTD